MVCDKIPRDVVGLEGHYRTGHPDLKPDNVIHNKTIFPVGEKIRPVHVPIQ